MESTFGRYRIEELLGRGGMGEVYRAYDTETDRRVALKVLPPHLAEDAEYKERFRRECRAAARLREPHIVPIHQFGEIDGSLYLDMRLVEGTDLATWLRDHGPMPAPAAVSVVSQVAAALDAAHADGLVHRDVKPSNVLLAGIHDADVDAAVFAYLFDFGIARAQEGAGDDPVLTRAGTMPGSLAYIAPERFAGVEGDPRADVYSLACVLYQSLTGRAPYEGDLATLMHAHLNAPPPRPSTDRADLPAGLDEVVEQGMAKDPDRRFASAGALAGAARSALGAWENDANASTSAFPAVGPNLRKADGAAGSRDAVPVGAPGALHANSGGQYPGSGGQYPGSGGQYPGSGGQYPGSGGQYPGQYPPSGGQYPAGGPPPGWASNPQGQQPGWNTQQGGWPQPQPAYGPGYPGGPPQPGGRPPRRNRTGVIAAALVAVVAVIGAAIITVVLLNRPGGTEDPLPSTQAQVPPTTTQQAPPLTTTPSTPSAGDQADVQQLLADLPAGYSSSNCTPDTLAGSIAYVQCLSPPATGVGPSQGEFARYASPEDMNTAFEGFIQGAGITRQVDSVAECGAPGTTARSSFTRGTGGTLPGGQVGCYTDTDGSALLFWTDERVNAIGYIENYEGDAQALYDWFWENDFQT